MTLNDVLAISNLNGHGYCVDVWAPENALKPEAHFVVERWTAPEYTGPYYNKGMREKQKEIKKLLELYGGCQIKSIYLTGSSVYIRLSHGGE